MKKFLLGLAGLVALAAPASAADLAARPYTKAPPPMIAAIYDWSGFYIGANGGWGSSRKCWDLNTGSAACSSRTKVATMRPAAPPAARSVIAGRPAPGCSASKARATGLTSAARNISLVASARRSTNHSKIDAFGLFTGQVGYASNNVLLYVKGGAAVTDDRYRNFNTVTGVRLRHASTKPAGAAWSVSASNTASPRTGRRRSNTTTCSWAPAPSTSTRLLAPVVLSRNDRIRQDVDLVTVRVNYRWGGPVVAKY